jgi:hypothetical protein
MISIVSDMSMSTISKKEKKYLKIVQFKFNATYIVVGPSDPPISAIDMFSEKLVSKTNNLS